MWLNEKKQKKMIRDFRVFYLWFLVDDEGVACTILITPWNGDSREHVRCWLNEEKIYEEKCWFYLPKCLNSCKNLKVSSWRSWESLQECVFERVWENEKCEEREGWMVGIYRGGVKRVLMEICMKDGNAIKAIKGD